MKEFIETSFTTVTEDGQETRVPDLGGYETNQNVQYSVMDKGDGTCMCRVTAPETTMEEMRSNSATTTLQETEAEQKLSANRERATLENLDQPDVEVDEILNKHSIDELLTDADKDVANIVLNWSSLDREDKQEILEEYNSNSPQDLIEDVPDSALTQIVIGYDEFDGIPDHIEPATAARIATQRATVGNQVLQDQELTAIDKAAIAEGLPNADEIPSSSRGESPNEMSDIGKEMVKGSNDMHKEMLEYLKGRKPTAPWKRQ